MKTLSAAPRFRWGALIYLLAFGGTEFLPARASDGFGTAVAIARDVNGDGYDDVLVGAYQYFDGSAAVGAAFLYHGSPDGASAAPAWSATGQVDSFFGFDVTSAGDVNGDGFGDIVVGAPWDSTAAERAGRAEVYLGSLEGLGSAPAWSVDGAAAFDFLGDSVAAVDVNGDGYHDVVVGIPGAKRIEVFAGSAEGLPAEPTWFRSESSVSYGNLVRAGGDVNGDGFGEVLVGDSQWFRVTFGGATGLGPSTLYQFVEEDDYNVVAAAGDVNGDGYGDLITGMTYENVAAAYLGPGNPGPYGAGPDWVATGFNQLGAGATGVGDFNADGADDVAVADPSVASYRGEIYVFIGTVSGLGPEPAAVLSAGEPWLELGNALAGGGDVNGDGYDDVVAGNRAGALPFPSQERVFLFAGGGSGVASTPLWSVYGRTPQPVGARADAVRARRSTGNRIVLQWDRAADSCDWPGDYQVYQGALGDFSSHRPATCSPFVSSPPYVLNFDAGPGDAYFLVVPHNGASEGSYGLTSEGIERGQGAEACRPQRVRACE